MEEISAKEIRRMAWQDLAHGQYWPFLGGTIVLNMITGFMIALPILILLVLGVAVGFAFDVIPFEAENEMKMWIVMLSYASFASIVLVFPLTYAYGFLFWGKSEMVLSVVEGRVKFGKCFSGWGHGWKMGWTVMIKWTYLFLWWLLIIPGIIKTFSYAMTEYVQVDHPDWNADQCIDESRRLMEGNRWRLFYLGFSFIVWYLLILGMAVIPMGGLAQWFFQPYPLTAFACFYRLIQQEKGVARS